jgi:nitroreductase
MEGFVPEIERRRALRALDDSRPVPADVIRRILAAAALAPSCGNTQPWRFVVASEEPTLSRVKEGLSGGNYWAKKAPLIILVLTKVDLDASRDDGRDYAFFDTGMANMALMMQATREGLIAHSIAGYDPVAIKQSLGIPAEYTLITLVTMGYPGREDHLSDKHKEQEHSPRVRKDPAEVVSWNRWFA